MKETDDETTNKTPIKSNRTIIIIIHNTYKDTRTKSSDYIHSTNVLRSPFVSLLIRKLLFSSHHTIWRVVNQQQQQQQHQVLQLRQLRQLLQQQQLSQRRRR